MVPLGKGQGHFGPAHGVFENILKFQLAEERGRTVCRVPDTQVLRLVVQVALSDFRKRRFLARGLLPVFMGAFPLIAGREIGDRPDVQARGLGGKSGGASINVAHAAGTAFFEAAIRGGGCGHGPAAFRLEKTFCDAWRQMIPGQGRVHVALSEERCALVRIESAFFKGLHPGVDVQGGRSNC